MEPGYTNTTRATRSAEVFLVGDSRKAQNEKLGSFRWSGQAPEEVTGASWISRRLWGQEEGPLTARI